ncbi:MAG: adenylyltransferase/cytidyltransferase family protein, partial [Methanobrevibacter sp.]|nr:adenylyltransferase/cytidyltransferase family protein [Methanobrevibacter sp.]
FLGTCSFFGIGASFDKTIESYLQKLLNDNKYDYKVENASQFYAGRYQDIFYNLNALPVKSGDIICIFIQDLQPQNFPFLDIRNIFNRPHNYGEVFADESHLNERGYKIIADVYYNVLVQHSFLTKYNHDNSNISITAHSYGIPKLLSIKDSEKWNFNFDVELKQKLNDYKAMLRKNRLNIGCIVMNCNPFTLGHRYLIEYASSKVEMLYIFVVEEDKSEFTFEERLRLVKKGVEDIPNVKVLPSGKFIISQLTFSGYFNKSKLQNESVDSKFDIELFAKEIAPALGINVRFAGEEPNDTVTRQYNENMKIIFPKYGINFIEIPRKSVDNQIISAHKVRDLLKEGKFHEIEKMVPKTTLEYLK